MNRTELIILIVIWIGLLISYSLALINNYELSISNYLGLVGIIIVSLVSYLKPKKSFISLLILLAIGLTNLISFVYFIEISFFVGFASTNFIRIQLYPMILIVTLVLIERKKIVELFNTDPEILKAKMEESKQSSKNRFKGIFENLSDKEIEIKLQQNLLPEAIAALKEIIEERTT